MQQKKNLVTLLALLLLLSLSSCAHVDIADTEWCATRPDGSALCFKTLSNARRSVEKDIWDIERVGQVCSTSDTFAEWKKAILKLCSKTRICRFEEVQVIRNFDRNVKWASQARLP